MRLVLAALLLPALAAPVPGQGRTERHPELGLTLNPPEGFEAVPLPPEERLVVLRYVESAPRGTRRSVRPLVELHRMESAEPWLEAVLGDWQREPRRTRTERWGHRTSAFDLASDDGRVGYLHLWEGEERCIALVALCAAADAAEVLPPLVRVAERVRLEEPRRDDRLRARLERRYSGSRWADPEHRIAVGLALVEGWEMHDSEHYVVVHPELARTQVEEVIERIEVLRRELGELFEAHLPREVVSTVRLCRDRDEYLAYGGPPQFAGYWNARAEELVLFDPGPDAPEELRRVLHHELFHQFVFHAAGGVTPHPFFGEGWADHVAGAVLERGRVARIEPHPWRLRQVVELWEEGDLLPLEDLLELDADAFYELLGPAYAQAWSLVAWLRDPSTPRRTRERLGRYFDALRTTFAAERRAHPGARWLPSTSYARARAAALSAFLEGTDPAELERGWHAYLEELAR